MVYRIYKKKSYFIKILILINIIFLLYISYSNAEKLNKAKDIEKNSFNEETLMRVLRSAGLNEKDSYLATKSFKLAYPPEVLTESSYLILPFAERKFNSFAINIDGIDAVLIAKVGDNFRTFITSTQYAQKVVENGLDYFIENENLLEIENHIGEQVKNNTNFIEEDIIFNKRDTLLGFLYVPGSKRKEISSAIKSFATQLNPSKITLGTKGKIIRTNTGKLIGFYLKSSKNKSILTYLSSTGYESVIAQSKNAEDIIKNNIESYVQKDKKFNSTRISLLNSPQLKKKKIKITKGNNLFNVLINEKIDSKKIGNLLYSLQKIYSPKKIRPEQEIILAYDKNNFFGLSIGINELVEIQVIKTISGFKEYIFKKPIKKIFLLKDINIQNSLYEDSLAVGLPQEVLIDMVRLFSYSIDFQRDIRRENLFTVYYEFLLNYKGEELMPGNIIYANANLDSNNLDIFRYDALQGDHKYFNSEGESIRKTLMKTPIDGARLSSRFGKRRHPVLGFTKMHKGVDFAAKKGTPIYAAGDGVIERANVYGGYGKYIRIKHNSQYKTAYAHLYKFARSIKKGKSVKQGQIIGYVGSTGRSTGPHLHYEILFNNKQINPQKLKLPEGRKLKGEELEEFIKIKESILQQVENN